MYDIFFKAKLLPHPFTGDVDLQTKISRTYTQILYKTWLIGVEPSLSNVKYPKDTIYLYKDGIHGITQPNITKKEWEELTITSNQQNKSFLLITNKWLEEQRQNYCPTCHQRLRNR